MVNSVEFTKRLEILLEEYDLSAASFAQKIAVGRASISHILSGRNKPSLDFVMKIITAFPEVDLYWLLNGKGSFPTAITHASSKNPITAPEKQMVIQQDVSSTVEPKQEDTKKTIDKIVIFYKDGSFDSYMP